MIVLKRDKLETQLTILRPCQGHALKKNQEQPMLIPLIQIYFQNEMKKINYNEILMKIARNREIQQ
jgi:hypothetical protein